MVSTFFKADLLKLVIAPKSAARSLVGGCCAGLGAPLGINGGGGGGGGGGDGTIESKSCY